MAADPPEPEKRPQTGAKAAKSGKLHEHAKPYGQEMDMKNERALPSCVDWAACEAECEREEAERELFRGLAESEAEDSAMERYYESKYGD